jgi:hypothetical protein
MFIEENLENSEMCETHCDPRSQKQTALAFGYTLRLLNYVAHAHMYTQTYIYILCHTE